MKYKRWRIAAYNYIKNNGESTTESLIKDTDAGSTRTPNLISASQVLKSDKRFSRLRFIKIEGHPKAIWGIK